MMRYSTMPWPLVGLLLALALLGQEYLLTWFDSQPSLTQTSYRMLIMTIGITSLALILLPPRRPAYLLGFLVCAGLIAWAYWLEYVHGLEPCPLCMFQRVAVVVTGLIFLAAALHNPSTGGAVVYAVLTLIAAGTGAALAAWQVWIQAQPKGSVAACGMGLNYMMETMPFTEVIARVLKGSGECAEQGWLFMNLAIPAWTFVFFVAMIIAAFALIRRY
jgi:protein dithiol:quinone oxidoreductase